MEHLTQHRQNTLQVLFFSVLREQIGQGMLTVQLSGLVTGEDLLDHLEALYPAVGDYRPVIRLAVNEEYVSSGTPLEDGDEVALITPVSGG